LITYEYAKQLLSELDTSYQDRHFQHTRLRQFWQGRFWERVDTLAHGLASIFRDVTSTPSDIGPDWKLVLPLVNEVCVKYQSYLSGLPMIRTFTERPESRRSRAQADLKERVLYGSWAHTNMNQQLNRIAWYVPLMGDAFLGIWPDFEYNCVKAIVRSPEHAFPLPSFDGSDLDAILFMWKTTPARAKRAFPNWSGPKDDDTKEIEVLEYSSNTGFQRWVDTQETNRVEHNLGFNLFDQVPFIHVPGEPWNHGAVEQAVGLVEAGSALYSLMMQAMIENVFPRMVLVDPMKFSETIDTGPGAVIPVNPGGDLKFVSPGGEALGAAAGLLQENERAVKQAASTPDVAFGQSGASIITGKAVNALQGAGTGSVVEMVQGTAIGSALESWNEKALTIYQRMFSEDTVRLFGMQPTSMFDINPRQFSLSFKGSEIIGSPRNEVVFSPYMDMHGKLVMALQAQGAGLTSKQYGREQIGISDSEEMQEQIVQEAIDDAVVGAIIQALQEPTPEAADQASAQATSYLSGGPTPVRAGPPPAPPGPPPGGGGGGMPIQTLPGGGQQSAPALPLPPGSAFGQVGAPSAAAPSGPGGPPASTGAVTLPRAQSELSQAQIVGKAWLVGQIVQQGSASTVEVAITDNSDKQTLADAADFTVTFHLVSGKPKEQAVEITPVAKAA
jgi:hypothetical protein